MPLRNSPTPKISLHDCLSPALWAFLASSIVKGLMLTGVWVGCFEDLAKTMVAA